MRADRRRREAGFTLIEVLIAAVIGALALAALAQGSSGALRATAVAAAHEEALSRARSRLEAIRAGQLRPMEDAGDDGGGFRWHVRIAAVAAAPGATLYEAQVTIAWDVRRSVTLVTRLAGPG